MAIPDFVVLDLWHYGKWSAENSSGDLTSFFSVFFQSAQNLLHFLVMGNFGIVTQQVSQLLLIFVVCDSFVNIFRIKIICI